MEDGEPRHVQAFGSYLVAHEVQFEARRTTTTHEVAVICFIESNKTREAK